MQGLLISMDPYLRLVLDASVVDLDVEALREQLQRLYEFALLQALG